MTDSRRIGRKSDSVHDSFLLLLFSSERKLVVKQEIPPPTHTSDGSRHHTVMLLSKRAINTGSFTQHRGKSILRVFNACI